MDFFSIFINDRVPGFGLEGQPPFGWLRASRRTLDSPRDSSLRNSRPSLSSSPSSAALPRLNSPSPFERSPRQLPSESRSSTGGLPILEVSRQYITWKPARCQRITVSGETLTRVNVGQPRRACPISSGSDAVCTASTRRVLAGAQDSQRPFQESPGKGALVHPAILTSHAHF
jgi:hypothetical protein